MTNEDEAFEAAVLGVNMSVVKEEAPLVDAEKSCWNDNEAVLWTQ